MKLLYYVPLNWIVFSSILEQTIFNGNSGSAWNDSVWCQQINFDTSKKLSLKSYTIIHFWNETRQGVSIAEMKRSNCYLMQQSCWIRQRPISYHCIKSFPLSIWSHLLKKSLMENFIICAVHESWNAVIAIRYNKTWH